MRSVRVRDPEVARKRRRVARIWVPLAILAWALATLAFGAVARYDTTCRVCHAMKPFASALETGEHTLVTCAECHATPGITGMFADGMAMHRRVVAAVLRTGVRPTSPQSDRGCRACHANVLVQTIEADGIAVRHSDFSDAQCAQCHGATGHRLERRVYPDARMDDCLACHRTNAMDPTGCDVCHVGSRETGNEANTTWGVMHGPNWSQTHGAGDITTCESCHPRDYCVECHGAALPHPETWARGHGAQVLGDGQAACRTCHDDGWCSDCHGEPMPHGADFARQHPEAVEDPTDPRCTRCHDAAECEACHLNAHGELPTIGTPHRRQMSP